jgi:hypothetical protein
MMDRSERLGLGVATAAHIVLFGALSLGLLRTSIKLPPPQNVIDVSLADAVALESRTTNPAAEPPQAATAPELGAVEPEATPPEPVEAPPIVTPPPAPRVIEPAKPKPLPRDQAKPTPAKAVAKPDAKPEPKTAPKPQRAPRLGKDFLKGLDVDAPSPRKAPAVAGDSAPVSAMAARALNAEINRQLKPFWKAPTGADVELLVTIIAVDLNRDGSIASAPRVVSQSGDTASNRGQKQLHAENAVRAVRLAAPFRLPPDLYDAWRSLEIKFDKRLSQ